MNTDINNESLQDAAKRYNDIERSYLDRPEDDFKAGANWQKQKDNIVIDKLVASLKDITDCYEDVMNLKLIENAKQLLESIKDI